MCLSHSSKQVKIFPMNTVINLILPFFGLILMGFTAGKFMAKNTQGIEWLNTFVIYFALPPLIFQSVASAPVEQLTNWPFVLATTFSSYTIFIFVFAISITVFKNHIGKAAVQSAAASYGNIGYMGLALTVAALGSSAAIPATLIFCFDSTLHYVLVPLLNSFGKSDESNLTETLSKIFKTVFFHPFIIATILGVAASVFSINMPQPVDTLLDFLSRAAAPCALFVLGVTVAYQPLAGIGRELPLIIISKTILHPLLVVIILSAMGGFDPLWVGVAVLMASLPTAANVFVMAVQFDEYVEGVSSSILITTAISFITVSLVLIMIDRGKLPLDLF